MGWVPATMLSERIGIISLAESAARAFRLRKKTMNLCACDSEEREYGVGAGVNATILSEDLTVMSLSIFLKEQILLLFICSRMKKMRVEDKNVTLKL